MIVHGPSALEHWRAMGFYGHLDTNKRYIFWQLLKSLNAECNMPWVVFGDFNEIMYLYEKLGGVEREARQMEAFQDCMNKCGLVDLGFVGQKFTWCNGRDNDSKTKLRLDRMVANEEWLKHFSDARVFHTAMSISNHCLLKLKLSNKQN